jgi:DNA polymerase-3 subunit gamma/tau
VSAVSLALYRKYRPSSFAEVIGQEHVTEPLQQALRNGRVHHAYLFSGPRGCGKTSSARILARSLNCEQGPTPTPCGVCQSCTDLSATGPGSLDVIEIDAASHGGVDDARDLRERSFYAPVSSRFKIYIIDEAHMVTTAGFNALLKLVEEPPPHLKFVFATTEPEKVIGTIRSRTHHYPFRLVPPAALRENLAMICAAEGVAIEPAALGLVVRAGAGSVRDSQSVLDQLIAGSGEGGVTYASAVGLLGYTDASLLDDVVEAFGAHDGAAVLELVDRVIEAGHDPRRFAEDLLERLRDLIVLTAIPDAGEKGLIDAPVDVLEAMRRQAAALGSVELTRAADIVNTGLTEMRGATAPRLLLELICARVLLPAAADDEASLLVRLERLERRLALGAAPAVVKPAAPAAPIADVVPAAEADQPLVPVRVDPPATGQVDATALRQIWDQVLEAVKRGRRATHALLLSGPATIVEVRGNVLVLGFTTGPLERQFKQGNNEEVLRAALQEILGVDWRIESTLGSMNTNTSISTSIGSPPSPPPSPPPPPSPTPLPSPSPVPDPPAAAAPVGLATPPVVAPAAAQSPPPEIRLPDASWPAPPAELDEPEFDDADVDDAGSRLDLLKRQLGATVIDDG